MAGQFERATGGRTASFDLAVFVGRFQPFHLGHLRVVEQALASAERVLVIVGSADAARRPDTAPFTAGERAAMIHDSLPVADRERVLVRSLADVGDLTRWTAEVEALAADVGGAGARIALIGHTKDRSSGYLEAFPRFERIEAELYGPVSATQVRRAYFDADRAKADAFLAKEAAQLLPAPVRAFLKAFQDHAPYEDMVEEQAFADRYRAAWATAPYPPIFVTADAVVTCADKVLLIRRKRRPGMGLWALPGGFVEQDEPVLDAAVRELHEETGLHVTPGNLRRAAAATRVFDAPTRDIRGRMITHATLFRLPASATPPAIAAADDATAAEWVAFDALRRETLYGDHFQIIDALTRED